MKNMKAHTIWNKALKLVNEDRIHEMRMDLKIPQGGFLNEKVSESWLKHNKDIALSLLNKLHEHIDEVSRMSDFISTGFSPAIEEYIIRGDVSEQTFEKCNSTGCHLKFVAMDEATSDLPMGIYIHLGPYSSPTDIKAYVTGKITFINTIRGAMYPNRGSRPKSEDYLKNDTVFQLGTMPLVEMREMAIGMFPKDETVKTVSRDILGSRMMKRFIYDISPESFRSILHREQKKRRP